MNGLAISIVHPAFENLKRMGRFFHFIAGLLVLVNAIHQLQQPVLNHLYFWCQLFIGLDILVVVFTNRQLAVELPTMNWYSALLNALSSWVPLPCYLLRLII